MCCQIKTIAKNCNGQLTHCERCGIFHFTFNNIYIEFTKKELASFQKYVNEIDTEYWAMKYDRTTIKRKIRIGTLQNNLSMVFNLQEIESMKELLFSNTKRPGKLLSVTDVDYLYILN
ncbi:MAG: DUF6686 family protein [Bacteroidota bacterium]